MIQGALVVQAHVLTDKQLSEAVVITRSTPGPVGLYVVSVGYFVAGVPRGDRRVARDDRSGLAHHPADAACAKQNRKPAREVNPASGCRRKRGISSCSSHSSRQGRVDDLVTIGIAIASLLLLLTTKLDTLWIILGAAVIPMAPSFVSRGI